MLVAAIADIEVLPALSDTNLMDAIIAAGMANDDTMLDLLDAALQTGSTPYSDLESALAVGNSVWTVRQDGRGLEHRVDPATLDAYKAASSPTDAASAQLQEAWSKAYGRNPDASDAWDHAIKAVETVLVPIVTPNNPKATLGNVLGDLKASSSKLTFGLQTSSPTVSSVETIVAMLRLIWPNPDRHGGAPGTGRTPSLAEAQAVLQIAITIVNWVRVGIVS